jgi:hypothetical protein
VLFLMALTVFVIVFPYFQDRRIRAA